MTTAEAIAATGLVRRFGDVLAVDQVSLRVEPGEVYGLLGANGAGKTTTLRMLAGLLTPTEGQATIAGFCPINDPIQVKRIIGYLTGDTALYARLTPRETMQFFGGVSGFSGALLTDRIEALARDLDLFSFLDRRCGTLSTGQRQRVAIARALIHDPQVLILDEPTAALDVVSARFINQRVRAEAARGRAVLLSTHKLSEAQLVCDRIGVLHAGRLIHEGSLRELQIETGTSTLTEAFLALVERAEGES
jgi:sodium transport system ATP-binding protein